MPLVGDDVLYTPAAAEVGSDHWLARAHPAIVTHVHDDGTVNLVVFLDGYGGVVRTRVPHRSVAAEGAGFYE